MTERQGSSRRVGVALAGLPRLLRQEPAIADLLAGSAAVVAVPDAGRAITVAALAELGTAPVMLLVTPTSAEAERLVHDLAAFAGPERVELFPAWETLPFERVSPATETMGQRLSVLWRIRRVRDEAAGQPGEGRGAVSTRLVVVAPVKALLQRLAPGASSVEPVVVRAGDRLEATDLLADLVAAGYRREYQVEHRGEVAVRGGILDVFPSTADCGVRLDLFGDEVDRLTEFDVADQRSVRDVDEVLILPCRELLPDAALRARALELAATGDFATEQFARIADGEEFDGIESFLPWLDPEAEGSVLTDLLGERDRVLMCEPRRMRDRALELADEEAALADALSVTWGLDAGAESVPRLHLGFDRLLARCEAKVSSLLPASDDPSTASIRAGGWPPALGDATALARRIGDLLRAGCRVVAALDGEPSARRVAALLEQEGLSTRRVEVAAAGTGPAVPQSSVEIVVEALDRGFALDLSRLAVLSEPDLTGRRRPHRVPRARQRPVEGFFDDLAPGSYVVHHVHGVARYGGMVKRSIGGAERDYLLLEYRGGDKLYVPSDQIDTITPYSGGEQPTLNRLNGSEWQKARARVRAAVREVAQELVVLYRRRLATPGHAFGADTPWQAELEQSFPYPETPDQLRAIAEVKADMEAPNPMDRLVCGDVGFGKTEVGLRAVFKAVQDGKQAAVLVPTTLLAQQHYQTFSERFAPFPVRVEMLSRFLTPGDARKVVAGLGDGSVDVVIGTHRLLAGDVRFKDLGLLVVDEEQRFGVSHKEAIKQLSVGVDVLTLTASPIPRTLEMGLTGIRDLSLIDTPPAARQPILTYVGELDERAVAEAIRRELLREGQVFYVHNRVQDIQKVAAAVAGLVPEARVAVAHGQMDEGSLEKVVLDFADGGYDVLVCTTIIESGIDMPTVNTLVVDRADLLGLGQLHQLRGRVGRAGQRAYAYLFYPTDRTVTEQAYERLKTIGELTELGSGFKIAMRDLEIRGAGNLLGIDQSGHIAAMGYDLYVRMVAEAVAELKGEPIAEPAEIKLDMPVEANLPASYVEREDLRLEAYRRLAAVRQRHEVEDIAAEWADRFGPPPVQALALLAIARLRAECVRTGVREVNAVAVRPGAGGIGRPGEVVARISPLRLPVSGQVRLSRLARRAVLKEDPPELQVPLPSGPGLPAALSELLRELLPEEAPAAPAAPVTASQAAAPSAPAPAPPPPPAGAEEAPARQLPATRAVPARPRLAGTRRRQ
ncbi:MAG TPA: transcription-repair coupling factor [Acidimicrobiales bacterium]|nr:transcription-repair coupling factor [Acidimicrobiales bacterium]